jgi:putative nucleotidyltransferase with HDIG domain
MASAEQLKILVVDDEATIRSLISQLLEQLGEHEVLIAENGQQALDLVQKNTFDCAFVDLMMPGPCGTELLDSISRHSPNTYLIIITGFSSMEVVIDTMRHGAVDFIPKPFGLDDIRLALGRMSQKQQQADRNRTAIEEAQQKGEVQKLSQALEKRSKEQAVLCTIADKLSQVSHTGELCNRLVHLATEVGEAEKSWFAVFDESRTHLMTIAERGVGTQHLGSRVSVNRMGGGFSVNLDDMADFISPQKPAGSMRVDTLQQCGELVAVPINIRNQPFGVLWIASKKIHHPFGPEDQFPLRFMTERAALAIENMALYENLRESLLATLHALVSAIEAKDSYTEQHSKRVTELAIDIAKFMGRTSEEIESLRLCGALHDIGKIGIHDRILNKPGKLTEEEFGIIKRHPVIGDRIVQHLGLTPQERAIVRNHHERWDGQGYPDGLAGTEIPLLARILTVADVFDAMTSDRTYRNALSPEATLQVLQKNRATQFDPEPLDALLGVLHKKSLPKPQA